MVQTLKQKAKLKVVNHYTANVVEFKKLSRLQASEVNRSWPCSKFDCGVGYQMCTAVGTKGR